jgi:15-cis-phytoene synthase
MGGSMTIEANIIRRHSRSFSIASRFLPRRVRQDVLALYAWCRAIDDAVDGTDDYAAAANRLAEFKADVQSIVTGGEPVHRVSRWLEPLIRTGRIDAVHAVELIQGMEMDCHGFHPRTTSELRHYCYHVAGTVGLMMARLMGTTDLAARKYAVSLGLAMQLTNIARDVREDALRGRSYLPGIRDPLACDRAALTEKVKSILELAEENYAIAEQGICYLPRDSQVAVRIALHVYREIGREIERQDYPVSQRRVVIGHGKLAGSLLVALFSSFKFNVSTPGGEFSMLTESQQFRVSQSRSAVCLGLSLTAIMASVLFVLVFVNPKEASYGYTPLVYSGLCILAAAIFHYLSIRFERKQPPHQPENATSSPVVTGDA